MPVPDGTGRPSNGGLAQSRIPLPTSRSQPSLPKDSLRLAAAASDREHTEQGALVDGTDPEGRAADDVVIVAAPGARLALGSPGALVAELSATVSDLVYIDSSAVDNTGPRLIERADTEAALRWEQFVSR